MPFAEGGDVAQVVAQVGEELREAAAAACQDAKGEWRIDTEKLLVVRLQILQACGGHDETAEHPGIVFLAIACIIADGLIERQASGREKTGIIDKPGQQGT